jgi:hypothetical protein
VPREIGHKDKILCVPIYRVLYVESTCSGLAPLAQATVRAGQLLRHTTVLMLMEREGRATDALPPPTIIRSAS